MSSFSLSQNSSLSNVTLPLALTLPPLFPGERVNEFQLEWRLDSLGVEKIFARDHSYFGIAPPPPPPEEEEDGALTSLTEITFPPQGIGVGVGVGVGGVGIGGQEEEEEVMKDRNYYLNRKIFLGGHGEIWLAKRILSDGHLELNSSYVLKRMHWKDRPAILRCALREIYFGELLQTNQRIAKYISYFQLHDDYWLVFRDEGVSLQSILYALTLDRGLPAFEPSNIWKRMRTTLRGEESMKSILYQIFLG